MREPRSCGKEAEASTAGERASADRTTAGCCTRVCRFDECALVELVSSAAIFPTPLDTMMDSFLAKRESGWSVACDRGVRN